MALNSMCGRNVGSSSCEQWKQKVCTQCGSWKLNQNLDNRIVNSAHKLMTAEECLRLKRDLRHAFFSNNSNIHFWLLLMMVLFIIVSMAIMMWLLAKAFILSKSTPDDCGQCRSQDRQMGGRSSAEDILQELQEKCPASTHCKSNDIDGLYVPPKFWDRFPMNEFVSTPKKIKQKSEYDSRSEDETDSADTENEQDNESHTEASNKSSEAETIEITVSEDLTEDEEATECSSTSEDASRRTGGQSEQSTGEDTTSGSKDMERILSMESLGQMPITYNQTATDALPNQSRRKLRWANWLRRSNPADFQV
ncbi:hypothetical protein KR093_007357 [Drosophila rubida]|uniref:Uncharacterized protein n=1 Tax=Drosophila rubida TaxID=30044 RepID=A0AAD4JU89_9MUSC|nr:hypothetical protein KR093_007357 [Drosophila rubida]